MCPRDLQQYIICALKGVRGGGAAAHHATYTITKGQGRGTAVLRRIPVASRCGALPAPPPIQSARCAAPRCVNHLVATTSPKEPHGRPCDPPCEGAPPSVVSLVLRSTAAQRWQSGHKNAALFSLPPAHTAIGAPSPAQSRPSPPVLRLYPFHHHLSSYLVACPTVTDS